MYRLAKLCSLLAIATFLSAIGAAAEAQEIITYYPPQATVTYLPVQRGLFGQRTSYQPVVSVAPLTTVTNIAPVPRVNAGMHVAYASAASTTYYAPVTPVTTTYYAPARVTTYHVAPAYYVAPAPVVVRPMTTYYVVP